MSSVLILFGSNGFIGSSVKKNYRKKFDDLIELDLNSHPNIFDFKKNCEIKIDYDFSKCDKIAIINCSGYNNSVENPIEIDNYFSKNEWEMNILLNLTLPFRISEFGLKIVKKYKIKVDIIFLGSLYSSVAPIKSIYRDQKFITKQLGYVASKHGLIGLTKGLNSLFEGENNIRCNTISLGAVFNKKMNKSFLENFRTISGGELIDVDKTSKFIIDFCFSNWDLIRFDEVKLKNGAFL